MSEDLINRFFKGQCDHNEAQTVLNYLKENKEAAENYTGRKEWDNVESSEFLLSKERSQQMLAIIKAETYQKPPSRISRFQWAIAASLILIVSAGLAFFKTNQVSQGSVALAKKDHVWRTERNTSDVAMDFILADGTAVKLEPQSTISYQFPFPPEKREVRLNGEGFFKVARDKKKPFTVFSGNLSTTALGTEFTINAFADKNTVRVTLHEGKVMIKRLNANDVFYLSPAEELTYNKITGTVVVNGFGGASKNSSEKGNRYKMKNTGVTISFEREPLENVFDQLEKAYHINLIYPESGLKDYYFTGNFNKTDSLERVLRIIAQTNKLEVIKTNSSYKIIKKR